jgi:carboxyl-terminal processing protease
MLQKGKLWVILFTSLVVLYGVTAAFIGKDQAFPAFRVFMDALKFVSSEYVEAPDMNKVQEGAMQGLIDALDPYSAYLTKDQVQELDSRKGQAGVGLILSKRAGIICVVSAERNRPAEKAGMRPGDYLVSIGGANVEDKSVLEADSLLHGEAGSKVKATVFRGAAT